MAIAFFITIILGLISVLLSLELDKLKKLSLSERKTLEDRIYKLSLLSKIQEKISYTTDVEKITDIIKDSLESFFDYSAVSSVIVKDNGLLLKIYLASQVGNEYVRNVEKNMLSSISSLLGGLPEKMEKKIHGIPLNDGLKVTHSSSFHIPLIVKNKVVALIHLSSVKENLYKDKDDIQTLYEIIEIAASSLTRFREAIKKEQDLSVSLFKNTTDGLFVADNKNNLFFINDTAKKMLGLSQNEVNFFDVVNTLPNIHLGAIINEVIINNKSVASKEIELDNKGVIDISFTPLEGDKTAVVLHDMTDYKKKEILKEDILHVMVHELRAPITTIKDASELIISTKDLEDGRKIKFLEIIHQQAKKLLVRISSILDTAKLDAGKMTIQKTKGDIAKLIKSEIQNFMPQVERKNISMSFEVLCNPLPLIPYDPVRISQVIDNLLSNSIKFTNANGKIKIEADCKIISPTLDGSSPMEDFLSLDKYVVISVSDTGIGISKAQQQFLFSKYTQAENAPRSLSKLGTGLGLYMVKGIIESHGGRVWVKSAPNEGTTVSFTLPTIDNTKASYDAPKSSADSLATLSKIVN